MPMPVRREAAVLGALWRVPGELAGSGRAGDHSARALRSFVSRSQRVANDLHSSHLSHSCTTPHTPSPWPTYASALLPLPPWDSSLAFSPTPRVSSKRGSRLRAAPSTARCSSSSSSRYLLQILVQSGSALPFPPLGLPSPRRHRPPSRRPRWKGSTQWEDWPHLPPLQPFSNHHGMLHYNPFTRHLNYSPSRPSQLSQESCSSGSGSLHRLYQVPLHQSRLPNSNWPPPSASCASATTYSPQVRWFPARARSPLLSGNRANNSTGLQLKSHTLWSSSPSSSSPASKVEIRSMAAPAPSFVAR